MTSDFLSSPFVNMLHLKAFFHPGKQTLYLCPQRVNQFETVAELGIVPINLGKHVSFRTVYPTNPRIRAAFCLLLAFVLLWHFHIHMLKLLPRFFIQDRTPQNVGIQVVVFRQEYHIVTSDAHCRVL